MHLVSLFLFIVFQGHLSSSNANRCSNFAFIARCSLDTVSYINKRSRRTVGIHVLHAGFGKTSTVNKKNAEKPSSLPDLNPEAKKYLQKHKNNIDAASADYFRSQMEKLPELQEHDDNTDARLIHGRDVQHEAKVAAAWNTIALFLPYDYSRNKGKVEPHVDSRLRHISSAIVHTPQLLQSHSSDNAPWILDIGCGDGSLIPYLKQETISSKGAPSAVSLQHYYGLDISTEMISLARERWRNVVNINQWIVGSFPHQATILLKELCTSNALPPHVAQGYTVIVFNGSLQFFQDTTQVLKDAAELLQPGGRIILSHVNGADFVKDECKKNPGIAVRYMPNNISLDIMAHDLGLKVIRKKDMDFLKDYNVSLDGDDGKFYLAVLEKPM